MGRRKPDAGTSDADASVGDADVSDADVGDGDVGDGDTGRVPFTLRIERAPRTSAHPLCDPRVFASFHPLCVATSEMPVRATLDVSDGLFVNAELAGMLRVPGAELREVDLSLKGTGADVAIIAQWIANKWLFCVANHATGRRLASCTLDTRL